MLMQDWLVRAQYLIHCHRGRLLNLCPREVWVLHVGSQRSGHVGSRGS